MIISANNNTSYGGTLINQKYSPLEQIVISNPSDQDVLAYRAIFHGRINALTAVNAFPKKLSLAAKWSLEIKVNEPPLVVISSNRAEWLERLFSAQQSKPSRKGYLDPNTWDKGLVLWYTPMRSRRPLFIVVHASEYDYYQKKLGRFNKVQVVGFQFVADYPALDIPGFGASRFAALQLVNTLGYHKAWTIDDNVVQINGFPQTLDTIEANLANNIWAIGFGAAVQNLANLDEVRQQAHFQAQNYNFGNCQPGFLQQAVLWNIDQIRANNKSISPYFVTSNEDKSFIEYMKQQNLTERQITQLTILKIQPDSDTENTGASKELSKRRNRLLQLFYYKERNLKIQKGQQEVVNLSDFVVDTILPNAQENVKKEFKLLTQARAVEQLLAQTVSNGWAPLRIFDPYNGFDGIRVERVEAVS